VNILRHQIVSACDIFNTKKLANINLMQAHIESLIRFSSTRTKLLRTLNRSRSICGWTIQSLIIC